MIEWHDDRFEHREEIESRVPALVALLTQVIGRRSSRAPDSITLYAFADPYGGFRLSEVSAVWKMATLLEKAQQTEDGPWRVAGLAWMRGDIDGLPVVVECENYLLYYDDEKERAEAEANLRWMLGEKEEETEVVA